MLKLRHLSTLNVRKISKRRPRKDIFVNLANQKRNNIIGDLTVRELNPFL